MKLRNLFLALAAGVLTLVSCEPEVDYGPAKISVNPSDISFSQTDGDQTISLLSSRDWKVGSVPDWIVLSASEGKGSVQEQSVKISVLSNSGHNRNASLVFTIGYAKATLNVEQEGPEGKINLGTGTKEDPFTAAGAVAYVNELGADVESPSNVYVKGKVVAVSENYSTAYGNASFTISDDGSAASTQFTAWRVLYLGNKKWTASDTPVAPGDDVILYGKIVNFKGNTPETAQNKAFLYSLNGVNKGGDTEQSQTEITATTVKDFIAKADGNTYYRLTGTVSSFSKGTNNSGKNWMQFNLTDNTGSILVYGFKDGEYDKWVNTIKNGGTVTLTGTYEFYSQKQQHEVMNTTIEKFEEGGTQTDITASTVANFIAKADATTYYRLEGTVSSFSKGTTSAGKNWMQFNLTDNTGTILVYGFKDGEYDNWVNTLKDGGTVTLTGTYEFYSQKQQHEVMNATIEKFTEGQGGQGGGGGQQEDDGNYVTDLSKIISLADNSSAKFKGLVTALTSTSFVATDGRSNVYVFKPATVPALGDSVLVSGTKTTYGGIPEISEGATVTVPSGNHPVSYPAAKVITGSFDSYTASVSEFIEFTGVLSKSGNYYNVTVSGASTNMGSISYPVASLGLDAMVGKEVAFKGYYVGLSGGKYINLACTSATVTGDGPVVGDTGSGITLTFPDDNQSSNGVSAYAIEWAAKKGANTWTIVNFNNNKWNNSWTYIKCGSKNGDSVASITLDQPVSYAVKKVVVTVDKISDASKIKSSKLVVASNSAFSANVQEVPVTLSAAGSINFTVSAPAANLYYKLVFDCAQASANGVIQLSKVVYSEE